MSFNTSTVDPSFVSPQNLPEPLPNGSLCCIEASVPSDDTPTIVDTTVDVQSEGIPTVVIDPQSPLIDVQPIPATALVVRRSTRPSQLPSYLKDYHCALLNGVFLPHSATKHPLYQYVSYSRLSPSHFS